ncbi:MAG: HEPN domain-containing protein [Armatimonadetes bacterium]|nr:HEPN domain-containing protein [Armatimonadota bacterium]
MPPDRLAPGSPSHWLERARGDLALASAPLPEGGFREDLCYHAQQAAEKAVKAVYVHRGWAFRSVHDLEELITGLERKGLTVPDAVKSCFTLTVFASESRYPRLSEPVTADELQEATAIAARVVRWADAVTRGEA